ncbi:MAG: hypothetical protein J7K23_05790 [Thermoproteales archaeon]|nr:hypothetical protein [Thermoproteales archaeon]
MPVEKLIIRITLRKKDYKVSASYLITAKQLDLNGYDPRTMVEFIYINSRHKNPIKRVQAWQLFDGRRYDSEKYIETLLGS